MVIVSCAGCGAEMERRRSRLGPAWCSDRCRKQASRPAPELAVGSCPVCGLALKRGARGPVPRYCSPAHRQAGLRRLEQGLPQTSPIREHPRGRAPLGRILELEEAEQLAARRSEPSR